MTPAFCAILSPDRTFLTGPSKYPSLAISSNRPSGASLGDNHPWTRDYLRNRRSTATYPSLVPGSNLPQRIAAYDDPNGSPSAATNSSRPFRSLVASTSGISHPPPPLEPACHRQPNCWAWNA